MDKYTLMVQVCLKAEHTETIRASHVTVAAEAVELNANMIKLTMLTCFSRYIVYHVHHLKISVLAC